MKIAPSMLACDFACIGNEVQRISKGGAELVHLDVMDGDFVPNISFGPAVIMKILGKGTALNQLWVFLLSPLIGALIAYIVYKLLKGEKIA